VKGKVCVVTGANSGVGKAMATRLAREGAKVVMVCRSPRRGQEALDEIREATSSDEVELELADLGSFDDVRALAERLSKRAKIDALLNNAGVYLPERKTNEHGHEMMLAVNHLAPFLLSNLLRPKLAESKGRVITTSSIGHSWTLGRFGLDNLHAEERYVPMMQYAFTKLANILFTSELARRHGDEVIAHCFHPGAIRSGFGQDEPGFFNRLISVGRVFMRPPEEGADTGVYLASAPEVTEKNGLYFVKRRPRTPSRAARDAALARGLWELSEEMTGLR
jgi:NAD(P)-dependent dehydrogenase (short-subunit alcohol dehydrogenase family)